MDALSLKRSASNIFNDVKLKTLVVVHPASLSSSAEHWICPDIINECRENISDQIRGHRGNIVILDSTYPFERDELLEDALHIGLENAVTTATHHGCLNPVSALRIWGTDEQTPPFDGYTGSATWCIPRLFTRQIRITAFLCKQLQTDQIEVTGAWATLDNSSGCVNAVANSFRRGMPNSKVRISETALFEEYEHGRLQKTPSFNYEHKNEWNVAMTAAF